MNILLTNIELTFLSGTVSYVYELAVGLKAQGHRVEIYTRKAGDVAAEIRKQGIHVTTELKMLKNVPDIIHAHHNLTTIDVLRLFKQVPVVYFLHDRLNAYDIPITNSRILKYVAVDYNCLDRLRIDGGIPDEYTSVIYNWVNVNRFKLREDFAVKPLRALVFSNTAKENNFYQVIVKACKELGIHLDVVGVRTGTYSKTPEEILPGYDLVFAKAKAAMEALSTGAAVVLCDFHGLGEMVIPANLPYLRRFNFGMKVLTRPFDVALMIAEIKRYNAENNRQNAAWMREHASFPHALGEIIRLYEQTIKDYEQGARGLPENTLHTWWLPFYIKIRSTLAVRAFLKLIKMTLSGLKG